ncbi:AMP-binding protein [Bacillus sp. JJ722]|uniref:AMP-binding protein n=1 Tax=Bacillus sp. JJ722 TaxID=3122973 RepID=UPI002FFEBA0A
MTWNSYENISKKLLPEIKDLWTVKDIVEKSANLGDEIYLIYAPTGKEYTYEESNLIANKIAYSLASLGLRKGDRIGIYMTNKPEYVFTLFAVAKLGLIEVPINPIFREAEISYMVNKAEITAIISDQDDNSVKILENVSTKSTFLKHIIVAGDVKQRHEASVEIHSLTNLMKTAKDTNPNIYIDESDPFSIMFTSGTTGLPKGAITSNKTAILASLSGGVTGKRKLRSYNCLPLFHANAQLYSTLGSRCLGATYVMGDKFSARNFFKDIIKYQADSFICVGGMMQILDATYAPEDVPNHPAKFVRVGGTPPALWKRFEEKFKVEVYEGYSMTEAPVPFQNGHPEKEKRKVGSLGKPLFNDLGRQVKLVDNQGDEVKVGIGELLQKGKGFLTKGYWNSPEAEKEAFDDEGWFRTGDVFRVDEEGYYYFVDRNKFMIRVGGENVSAFEVEAVVNSHPAVSECAAIPVEDPFKDEEIKMIIKLTDGYNDVDFKEIVKLCAKKMAYYKIPRFFEVIDDFPKTPTERIQKIKLKENEKKNSNHGWDRNIELPEWRSLKV